MTRITTTIEHEGMTVDVSLEIPAPESVTLENMAGQVVYTDPGIGPIAARVAEAAVRAGGFGSA